MSTYRATWPILDPRTPLADLLAPALNDLRVMLASEQLRQAGPVTWTLRQRGPRLLLTATAPVSSIAERRLPDVSLKPCGTHAAFMRHRDRGEPVDEACAVAERAYRREVKRAWRERHERSTAAYADAMARSGT